MAEALAIVTSPPETSDRFTRNALSGPAALAPCTVTSTVPLVAPAGMVSVVSTAS